MEYPVQSCPPNLATLTIVLVLVWIPSPQVWVQPPHSPNSPHSQSTLRLWRGKDIENIWWKRTNKRYLFMSLYQTLIEIWIPGQLCLLQETVRLVLPTHGFPPCFASCSIFRTPYLVPPPQVLVHSVQEPQAPQRQSTMVKMVHYKRNDSSLNELILILCYFLVETQTIWRL